NDARCQPQDQGNGETPTNANAVVKQLAQQIGLKQQQFDQCVDTKKTQAKIQAHGELALRQQIKATPSFIIGGKIVEGASPYDEFKAMVDTALARSGSPIATPTGPSAKTTPAPKAPARR